MMMPRCASHSGTSFGRLGCGRRDHSQNRPPSAFPIWPRRPLGDAIGLRNRLIEHLEEADTECAANDRESLLTFVVAGGGFAGVETIGSINDFLKAALPYYPNLTCEMVRVILVDPGEFVLPELGEQLGRYAGRKLAERGVEIRPNTKIKAVTSNGVELSDRTHINTRTLVWTAGTALTLCSKNFRSQRSATA